jgi:hypothetical protein
MIIFFRERKNVKDLNLLYIKKIVNKLFLNLFSCNPDLKYVKIFIYFYDNENRIMTPYFFTKDNIRRFSRKRYLYFNYLFDKLLNTVELHKKHKNIPSDFEIIIKYDLKN